MTFKQKQDNTFTKYEILGTSNNIKELCSSLQRHLVDWILAKERKNILVYVVEDCDPRLLSYDIITCLKYPSIVISIGKMRHFAKMYQGDRELAHNIKAYMPKVSIFNTWYEQLKILDVDELRSEWRKHFDQKPSYFFNEKKKLLRSLLNEKLLQEVY